MSLLIKGKIRGDWKESEMEQGKFIREDSQFRHWVTSDGSAGPSGEGGFDAEPGRYHLYVSFACPWAHRTLIFRKLKQLDQIISVSVVNPDMHEQGWSFAGYDGATVDHVHSSRFMHELYTRAQSDYTGIVTVPVLWDKKRNMIVNNESSEIIRMLNSAFNALTDNEDNYYPDDLQDEIDKVNALVYDSINNGVYRAGFATTQQAYDQAFDQLFASLDQIEAKLGQQRYLAGSRITEADWRLFTTLVRFDAVYYGHFKCNRQRLQDYINLSGFMRELYQIPGIAPTVNMEHIKRHYYYSHDSINPTRIVPRGPQLDFTSAHNRGHL